MKRVCSLPVICVAACLAFMPSVAPAGPAPVGKTESGKPSNQPAESVNSPADFCEEVLGKQRAVMLEYQTCMDYLRDKIMQKQMELDYLARNPNVKAAEIKAIIADIVKLHKEAREIGRELRIKLRESGLALFPPFSMQRQVPYIPNSYPGHVPQGRPFGTMPGAVPFPQGPWFNGYWNNGSPLDWEEY